VQYVILLVSAFFTHNAVPPLLPSDLKQNPTDMTKNQDYTDFMKNPLEMND